MVLSSNYSSSNPTSTKSSYQINNPYPYTSVEVPIYQASSSNHYNHMINSAYGISGNLAGNISYELFNGNTDWTTYQIGSKLSDALIHNTLEYTSTLALIKAIGTEITLPAQMIWSALEGVKSLKSEFNYLGSHGCISRQNMFKAELLSIVNAVSTFSDQLPFSTGIFGVNASASFMSRYLHDSYNCEVNQMSSFGKFDAMAHYLSVYSMVDAINLLTTGHSATSTPSVTQEHSQNILASSETNELMDVSQLIDQKYGNRLSFTDIQPINTVCQQQDLSDKVMDVFSRRDTETIQTMTSNLSQVNGLLEGANLIKNWKTMENFDRTRMVMGLTLKNIQSSTLNSTELKSIHTFGNLLMKGELSGEDFALLLASFPDTPLPVVDFLKYTFAIVKGDFKGCQQAFTGLALSILALSNPIFSVAQVLIGTIDLIKNLFTKVKIIKVQGIDAQFTDKISIRIRGFFKIKKAHRCSMDNDFFGIHVETTSKHASEAREQLEKEFNHQAFYKVYQVIGLPAKLLDSSLPKPEGRFNSMIWMEYLKSLYSYWLEVNDKYFILKL